MIPCCFNDSAEIFQYSFLCWFVIFLHFRLAFRALLVPPNIIYIIKENKHLKDMLQSSTLKKKEINPFSCGPHA